jgi:hypothetical protein
MASCPLDAGRAAAVDLPCGAPALDGMELAAAQVGKLRREGDRR